MRLFIAVFTAAIIASVNSKKAANLYSAVVWKEEAFSYDPDDECLRGDSSKFIVRLFRDTIHINFYGQTEIVKDLRSFERFIQTNYINRNKAIDVISDLSSSSAVRSVLDILAKNGWVYSLAIVTYDARKPKNK